jgi:DNA-binding NarL/FixJ family response regulator
MLHRQLVSPVLAGRRQELEALVELLAAAQSGTGRTALVGGDAGIGKTRLCHALKAEATRRQVRVIEGRCSPSESSVPYGPFMDALRFRLGKGEGTAAARVLEPVLAHLRPLFSALAGPIDTRAPEATARPFDAILQVFQRLAELGPVLLILEDVHWADSTSRDLLHYLARRIPQLPLLVVATYRTDETHPGHPIHRIAAALTRERAALRVHLEPLELADVQMMLEATLPAAPAPGFADAVRRRTEGNPLFMEELIGVLAQGDAAASTPLSPADLDRIPLPTTLHELVWDRLAPLPSDAREAIAVAAVIGRRFRFEILLSALRWPAERLLAAIELLVTQCVIVEAREEGDEQYAFRHSLVQEVLYASTIGRRRREWHRRVAAALEQTGGDGGLPHTALAHHYSNGDDLERARVHLLAAGDEAAALCAWKDAEAMYEQALAALERSGGDALAEADILERMADVAGWQDHTSAVAQYAGEALSIRRACGHHRQAATLLRRLASIDAYQRGDHGSAVSRLHEALELVTDSSAEYACLLNDLGRLHMRQMEHATAEALFERALTAAGRRADCAEEALSLVMLGALAMDRAEVTTGMARLELALALLKDESLTVERRAEVFHAGLRALDAVRRHADVRAWVDAALAFAEQHDARGDHAVYRAYQAAMHRRAGAWHSAHRIGLAAVADLRASGRAELREALRIVGDLQRGRGELEAARASYVEAMRLGLTDAAIGHALLFMAERNWPQAIAGLTAALEPQATRCRLQELRVLPHLIEAHAAAGNLDEARAKLELLSTLTAAADYEPGLAARAQAAGLVAAASGASATAVRELRSAAHRWRQLGLPCETARAQLLLSEQLVRTTRSRAAGIELATAAACTFEELGARLDIARAQHVLRLAGVRRVRRRRIERRAPEPLARLTPRECEVLFELARGRTNKQIARTLSLSPRTVGNHVSAILSKLGCATRTEASRLVPAVQAQAS